MEINPAEKILRGFAGAAQVFVTQWKTKIWFTSCKMQQGLWLIKLSDQFNMISGGETHHVRLLNLSRGENFSWKIKGCSVHVGCLMSAPLPGCVLLCETNLNVGT